MAWQQALEIVIAGTRHERYRLLCSEVNPCPHSRAEYRALMLRLASGEPPPARESEPPDPWRERIRECPDYQPGCCASPAPYCTRYAINPDRGRCIECLTADNRGTEP